MGHSDVAELADVYVLDALPADIADEIEEHITDCEECRALVDQAWSVARLLRVGVPEIEPPPSLHARLMEVVNAEAGRPRLRVVPQQPLPANMRRFPFLSSPALRWAGSAALIPLLMAGWLTTQVLSMQQQMHTTEMALTKSWQTGRDATEVMARAMQQGGGSTAVEGAEMAPAASGMLYYAHDDSTGVLVVGGLPPLPPDQVYQCWLMSGEKRMSGGMFNLEEDGRGILVIKSPMPLEGIDAMRVTSEPRGGSGEPRGSPYMWARIKGT